jgi:hypothetical protein
MSEPVQRLSHGYRTTEFWSTLFGHLVAWVAAGYTLIGQPFPDQLDAANAVVPTAAMLVSGLIQIGYSLSRGKVKAALLDTVAAMDDAAAVWTALFPGIPIPDEVLDASDAKRQTAAGFAGVKLAATRSR